MAGVSNARSGFARGISTLAIAAGMVMAAPATAQTVGTIQGRGAEAGSTVTATDTNTGRQVTATVNADGTFVIVGLRPSVYRIVSGSVTEDVTVPVSQTVSVDLSPEAEGASGSDIVVTGRRGRAEVRTATIGTSVSQAQINNLPQNDRNFLNFAALAPGVTVSNDPNNKRIQAGGVSSENVNVYIDGSSQKNAVGFGGVAGQNFSQGNPFPQSAVQEFRVETQNYKAEFEQAGSAIITAITKTGGDEFHGGAFVQFVPKSFYGRPFFDRPGEANNVDGSREKPDYKRYQFGGDLGGPIVPGVLHFFAAYEGTRQTSPALVVTVDSTLPPSFGDRVAGSFASEFKQDLYFGKLTLFASAADTINASYFRRNESDIKDYGGNRAFENGRNVGTSSENYQLEWNHRADTWLNEFTASRFSSFTGTPTITQGPEYVLTNGSPLVDDDGDGIPDGLVVGGDANDPTGADLFFFGANSFQQANDQSAYTIKNNFTYTGAEGHVIKAGARVSFTELTRIEDVFTSGQYSYAFQRFGDVDTSVPWRARVSLLPASPITAKNTQVGLFVQDDWTIDEHWTINAGLRWDYESNNFNNKFVTPDRIANALRNYQPWQAAGINPEDYITDGTKRDPFLGAFQPRIGISYDIGGDRDTVIFAGAGRYYDRNIFYLASLETLFNTVRSDINVEFCGASGLPICGDANGDGVDDGRTQFQESFRDPDSLRAAFANSGLSGDIWVINNDAKTPYTDQFTLGIRKQAGPWQLSAAVAHNRSHDAFIFVRGNRMPDGLYTEGGDAWVRDNFPVEGRPAGYTGRLNIGSSNGKQRYTALYLTADKPYDETSGWGATASLTVSDAESNQGIGFGEGQMFNAGRQDAYGWQRTKGLESFRFVGTGIVDIPWGFQASGTLTLSSGPSFGNVDFGRTPPPNCGGCFYYNDGGVFTPEPFIAYKNLDVRLAKTFTLPWGHEVTADFQVYNIFDWVNRNYETWGAGSGSNPTLEQNSTVGYARSFQAGLKYRF